MKLIKCLLLFCNLSCGVFHAQTMSHTILDKTVSVQKTTIFGLLMEEQNLLNKQKLLIKQIKDVESDYQNKISPSAVITDISTGTVFLGVTALLNNLESKINNIENKIYIRKIATFGIKHKIYNLESDLNKQKKYLSKLKETYEIILKYYALAGGTGYNYTAFLKLLLELTEIRSKIYLIDKEVKNVMFISDILAK